MNRLTRLSAILIHLQTKRVVTAKELAERFLVIRDAVLLHQIDEFPLRVAAQRGFREMRVLGEEIFGPCKEVGEITTPAAGDADFFAGRFGVIDHKRVRACMGCGHHSGSPCAKDERVNEHEAPLVVDQAAWQASDASGGGIFRSKDMGYGARFSVEF